MSIIFFFFSNLEFGRTGLTESRILRMEVNQFCSDK
jgi:hypothetical protein